ncbi:hypothetical protein G9A89_002740 [Geosiphon pyriformis]|nr:hypothetical protein G9A89_002740 [Geosiphon pyriformis]
MSYSFASSSRSAADLFMPGIAFSREKNNEKNLTSSRPYSLSKAKMDGADIRCRNCKAIKSQFSQIVRAGEEEIDKLNDLILAKDNRIIEFNKRLTQLNDATKVKDSRIRLLEDSLRDRESRIIALQDQLIFEKNTSQKEIEDDDENKGQSVAKEGSTPSVYSASSVSSAIDDIHDEDDKKQEIEWVLSFEKKFQTYAQQKHYHHNPQNERNAVVSSETNPKSTNRVYIGGIPPEIQKPRLKKCLEVTFNGRVVEIDMLPIKKCAFAEFAHHETYMNALNQGYIQLDGDTMHINRVKKHTLRAMGFKV